MSRFPVLQVLLQSIFFVLMTGLVLLPVSSLQAAQSLRPINIELTTHLGDKQTFSEGDRLSFLLSLNQPAFVYLFYEDATGNVLQIIPNRDNANHYFNTGYFQKIPGDADNFRFIVQAPFGQEAIYAFATDAEFIDLTRRPLANGLSQTSESIAAIEKNIKLQSQGQFGKAELRLHTRARE